MYASIEGSGESSLCSCVDAIEHSVAHNFDKIFFFKKKSHVLAHLIELTCFPIT